MRRQRLQRRELIDIGHGSMRRDKVVTQHPNGFGGQDGMPTQFEKVVGCLDVFLGKQFGPNFGQFHFDFRFGLTARVFFFLDLHDCCEESSQRMKKYA